MAALSVGYGEEIITPPLGLELSGYGFYIDRRAESVLDDLKCRALCLRRGRDRLVIVAFDLIGFAIAFADGLRRALARELGVPLRNVLIACTHTHTGPATLPLPGLGAVDDRFMRTLSGAAKRAAAAARADLRPAGLSFAAETVEPIGYNRRAGNFEGIDPSLKVAAFVRRDRTIFLLNYACHAVTLGRKPLVSADWPGAAVRALEAGGHRALILQGFCGDIDPVSNLNRWGEGTGEDLALYGAILAGRALKAARLASPIVDPALLAAEKRIRVPLVVPPRNAIEAEAAFFLEKNGRFPRADRFASEWEKTARARYDELASKPYLDNVPVQAMAIGGFRLLALPGEVFSAYGLILREEFPSLMTVGYANGNIGYLPSGSAFEDESDYGSRFAPMFYTIFPFSRDLPYLLIDDSRDVLRALG